MLRAPISLEKMAYDAASGTVIYREWLELLCLQHPRSLRASS
jgi:hypothetical protein